MKVDYRIRVVFCFLGVLMLLAKCEATEQINKLEQITMKIEEERPHAKKSAQTAEPEVVFESKVYDFGELGIKEKGECEFRFKNVGEGLLKIGKIKATCGCTIPQLSKKEYRFNEEGTIKVKYSGQSKPGSIVKHIFVSTNDKENSRVMLTRMSCRVSPTHSVS